MIFLRRQPVSLEAILIKILDFIIVIYFTQRQSSPLDTRFVTRPNRLKFE
jgi:hypothetical protein